MTNHRKEVKTMSMQISVAPGFVPVTTKLPKNVSFLSGQPDGIYLVAQKFIRPANTYNGTKRMVLPQGTVLVSTENGHYYRFNGNGALEGLGKSANSSLGVILVQRCSIDITVKDFVKPKPMKEEKDAIAKKKTAAGKRKLRAAQKKKLKGKR